MKLSAYLRTLGPGEELTCWDRVVDSEFYFYAKVPEDAPDEEFPNVFSCMDKLADVLDVVQIDEDGVVVNLYDLLEHPKVIQFAKDHLYDDRQYENDEDVVLLLFDDNVTNISQGYEEFSRDMIACLEEAYGPAGAKYGIAQIKKLEEHVKGADHLRAELAEMGIALDRFVSDEYWLVRKAVASHGYGLDILVNDQHWAVRKVVAKQGYGLDVLIKDSDWRVAEAARATLRARGEKTLDVDELLDGANARAGASAGREEGLIFDL